jgi:hypothetical protein
MILDSSEIAALKEEQLKSCPAARKVSLVITGCQEDAAAKATFYAIEGTIEQDSGEEKKIEQRYRYSQLFDFNETLIREYGAIRILRLFPPKKLVGNKAGDFVAQRKDYLQKWLAEIVADEELSEASIILQLFKLID